MKKIKVLHLIGGGEIGGAERLVLTLLKLLNRDRYEPYLICLCPGPFASLARANGIKADTIAMRHKLDISTIRPLREYMRQKGIDIVHTHGVRANLVGRIAAHKEKLPVVTTFHSRLSYDYDSRLAALVATLLTRMTNRYTDRFIAISYAIKEEILAMGVPDSKLQVIHNGLDTDKFKSNRDEKEVKRELGLSPDKKIVTMIARLHPVKGHKYFILAAREVMQHTKEVQFLIIGEGSLRPELEQMVRELHLEEEVLMPGYYNDIEDIYRISDLICVPSLMEGLGLVVLEAMFFRVPVIATRVGGIPEIIEDGKDGILIPPEDHRALAEKIIRLLEDELLRKRLTDNALKKIEKFTMENMTKQVEAIYDELAGFKRYQD
ncbi:N-acetyl-alpha-D-glucosaminyl L-malate synthase BshA [Thermosyntropha lipolytica DSM 11003]|uniref:N-acetyl-alpha-D-glucosaminyl L-malate synthase BshA n=1 Tax=Thermosyntropha lipolytica DSM 11003 TaxID=1123382 RepID=A0A1M5JRC9_9FIRM|nr:glycosyltransferase family 4 protein [Thermosyntropha lipolytica]SHG42975.1 N-acetyl-alpha-D-glucosaminyl L-malate synthase BshA [Thermosyntropha lipolytica DSM 11003]